MRPLLWFLLALMLAVGSVHLGWFARGLSPDDPLLDARALKVLSGLMLIFAVASCGMSVLVRGREEESG